MAQPGMPETPTLVPTPAPGPAPAPTTAPPTVVAADVDRVPGRRRPTNLGRKKKIQNM